MALRTLGTTTTTILNCLPAWSAVVAPADIAAIADAITSDFAFAAVLGGNNPAGPTAVLATGSTHGNATLDTLVAISGAPLAQIQIGDAVLGAGVVPGTFVQAIPSGTSVTLNQAATGSASIRVVFVRSAMSLGIDNANASAQLYVPNRGVLKILPGDIVAIDNLGWPILVSGASIGYAGTQWTLT